MDSIVRLRLWRLLVTLVLAPVWAGAQPVATEANGLPPAIVIDVDADNPPFMFSRGGYALGLYPALLRSALGRCHPNVRVEARPWKRAFVEIDKAQAGVGGLYKNAERLAKYDFSDPIYAENIAVYYRRARPLVFHSVTDLYGKTVGVLRGWTYGDVFDAAVRAGSIVVEEVSSDRSNFLKLKDGRVDAVLAVEESGKVNLAAPEIFGIDQAPTYLASYPVHLAFNKRAAKTELLACFNKALLDMKRDGSFDRIVREELGR